MTPEQYTEWRGRLQQFHEKRCWHHSMEIPVGISFDMTPINTNKVDVCIVCGKTADYEWKYEGIERFPNHLGGVLLNDLTRKD